MAFSDTDPLEEHLGVRCEDMTPDQLICYVKTYHETFGLNLQVEGFRERSVFLALQRLYGKRAAGLIVKWAFYRYRGQWQGEPIGFFKFSRGCKWWTDKMHFEVQTEINKSDPSQYLEATLGGRGLADL